MYNLIEPKRKNCYGDMEYPKYRRPFPPNFFTPHYVGVAVDEEKKICIFIDTIRYVVNSDYFRYSLSVCNITDITENGKKVCEEISGEPLWLKTLDEVMEYINEKY